MRGDNHARKAPTLVKTPLKVRFDSDKEIITEIPVLLPEGIIHHLMQSGLRIPKDRIRKYWAHHRMVGAHWATCHESSGEHIPIGLYGDGAKYGESTEKKVWGIWMNLVLFRPASVRMSRFLLFAVDYERMLGMRTMYPLLDAVVQSLNRMFDGFHGSCYAVTEIRGDWEFHYQVFRMTKFWNSSAICWRCEATKGLRDPVETSYLDFRDEPGWAATEITLHNEFLATAIQLRGPRCNLSMRLIISSRYFVIYKS